MLEAKRLVIELGFKDEANPDSKKLVKRHITLQYRVENGQFNMAGSHEMLQDLVMAINTDYQNAQSVYVHVKDGHG